MPIVQDLSNQTINDWFNLFISSIEVDKMMLEADVAPAEKREFYQNIISGNTYGVVTAMRFESTKFFIAQIVGDYIKELQAFQARPLKLAFDFSDAKILVWAEVKTDDEEAEDALILAEAKANEKYSGNGFFISSTIVEDCDNLPVPPHYRQVL